MRSYSHINRCKRCRTTLVEAKDIFSSGLDYWAKCPKCGKSISGRGDFETAIQKWNNTRKAKKKAPKVVKESRYHIEYMCKCRFCGAYVVECESGLERSHAGQELTNAILRLWVDNKAPVPILSVHKCRDGQFGIVDLIGQRMVKER